MQCFGKSSSGKNSKRNREKHLDNHSASSSGDDVNIIMEVGEPTIELDEFSFMSKIKKASKLPETQNEYIRKRSYSKEDKKIGLNFCLDSRAISPEYIISDEDEYTYKEANKVERSKSKESKNSTTYGRSLTVPSSWNKHSFKGLKFTSMQDACSPTKNTGKTCYSSNINSDFDWGNHVYNRRSTFMRKNIDSGINNDMQLQILSYRDKDQDDDLTLNDRKKYEKVIKMLSSKVNTLQYDLKASNVIWNKQKKLLALYWIKQEKMVENNVIIASKTYKAKKIVTNISNEISNESVQHIAEITRLNKENELLRKMLKIQSELANSNIDLQIKKEESKILSISSDGTEDKSGKPAIYDNLNPFNTNSKAN
jgi:hypothetical protein